MTRWLVTLILEKKKTLLDDNDIELGTKEAVEKEFSGDSKGEKAKVTKIQVGRFLDDEKRANR